MSASDAEFQFNIENDRLETSMFDSKLWQLGPDMEVAVANPTSPRPYVAHARLKPGQEAASAAHSGWSLVYILSGSAIIDGVEFKKGDLSVNEPWSASGIVTAGPDGLEEIAVYENGAAAAPYFTDPNDPRVATLMESLAENGQEFPMATLPPQGLTGKRHRFNNIDGRFETPYFSALSFEVGPLLRLDPDNPISPEVTSSPRPFFSQTYVPAGADLWPTHRHEGWAFLIILDGWYEAGDYRLNAGEIWLTSPAHLFDKGLRPGPQGVEEIAVFDNGPCVTPIVIDNSDENAAAFRESLSI